MHSISLFIVGVLAITICPYTHATTTESTELEEPKILPLTDAKTTNDNPKQGLSEFWQEDEREVLIRNERGAKDNNGQGTTTGKKQNKKEKNQLNKNSQKHLNKSPDTNSDPQNIPNNTQQQQHQTNVKKHQQKHEKHEKNSKKHGTTEKPKPRDESKNYQSLGISRDEHIIIYYILCFHPLIYKKKFAHCF